MSDLIDRQAAIDAIRASTSKYTGFMEMEMYTDDDAVEAIEALPSAQPERTCVNCGRTANNGGWYADGRTRCPIEEHYALPKDGYCHLWEKRNISEQPTVDAEPVRHGKWIEDGSFKYKHGGRNSEAKELFGTEWRTMRRIKCSLCNKITLVDDTILYEYCPHCGADMRGEQDG